MRLLPVAALAFLLAGCSSGSSSVAPSPTSPVNTPSVAASSPSAPPSPTVSPKPVSTVVTGAGSRFTKPAAPTVKTTSTNQEQCYGLVDAGFKLGNCDKYSSKLGTAIALIEDKGSEERDLVFTVTGSKASLVLRSVRQAFAQSSGPGVVVSQLVTSDLADDNTTKAVFLTPQGADYDTLASVDVVEASGAVVIHRDLEGGRAGKAFGGGLEIFIPVSGGEARDTVIQYKNDAWRVTSSSVVSSDKAKNAGGF